jgi:hypothetical protein
MNTLYYDIETKGDPERAEQFCKPFPAYDPTTCKVGNLKDALKIADAQQKHRAKYERDRIAHYQEARDKAALSPLTGEILIVQYARNDEDVQIIGGTEEEILREWWKIAALDVDKLVNWTGCSDRSNFDRHFLEVRSMVHDIKRPFIADKLWLDAAQIMLRHGQFPSYCKLENAARVLGIPVQDCGGVTGANFAQMWEEDRGGATFYATQDVVLLREIWRRMR